MVPMVASLGASARWCPQVAVQCVDRAALLHRLWKLQSSLLIEILVHSAETKGPEALQARVP